MVPQYFEGLPLTRLQVRITRIEFKIENGISSTQDVEYASILAHPGKIEDLKFVDDEKLMLAVSHTGKLIIPIFETPIDHCLTRVKSVAFSYLMSVSYRKQTFSSESLFYQKTSLEVEDGASVPVRAATAALNLDISDEKLLNQLQQHRFPEGAAWTPERIEINGRKSRRSICVVAKDRVTYRVFDLDSLHKNTNESEKETKSGTSEMMC